MTPSHKFIRTLLRNASQTEYERIIREAKLSPLEEDCMNQFILHNKTQYQIAAQTNLSERTVRLYLCHGYEKIEGCRSFAVSMPDDMRISCYAIGIGGSENVWNDESANVPAGKRTD